MKNDYFRSNGNSVTRSNGSRVNIDTSRELTAMDLSKVSSSGNKSHSLGSFLGSKSSTEEYENYRKSHPSTVKTDVIDINDDNKPAPPISNGVVDNGSGAGGGIGSGSSTDIGTVSNISVNTNIGTSSGIVTGSETVPATSIPLEGEKEESEIIEAYQEPTLPEVSGLEILQPLLDLKDSLLSNLNFSVPGGSCQALNIDFFGSTISSDIHCQLAEKIAPILSGIMILIYNILAFRIILSA